MPSAPVAASLACCHGFSVAAGDQPVGVIETPVFAGTALEPVALVVRARDSVPGTFRLVPTSLVVTVDNDEETVTLVASEDEILALKEFELGDLSRISRQT
jgi:hypothetical protein